MGGYLDGSLKFIDALTGLESKVHIFPNQMIICCLACHFNFLGVGYTDGTFQLWTLSDSLEMTLLVSLTTYMSQNITSINFKRGTPLVLVTSEDGYLIIMNIYDHSVMQVLRSPDNLPIDNVVLVLLLGLYLFIFSFKHHFLPASHSYLLNLLCFPSPSDSLSQTGSKQPAVVSSLCLTFS